MKKYIYIFKTYKNAQIEINKLRKTKNTIFIAKKALLK